MTLEPPKIQEIIGLVRRQNPGWDGFSHPQFLKDEVLYKQDTIDKARELIVLHERHHT